jgi:hypothetical protein
VTVDRKHFLVPGNAYFEDYWTRTRDRMTKIRLSENIRGQKQQLALFQPPIDPRQILAALAAGMSIDEAYDSLSDAAPMYRFSHQLRRAKDMASTVVSFGSTLLSALERNDAEGLAHLRASQEQHVMDLTTQLKSIALAEAESQHDMLKDRAADITKRQSHFQKLIAKNLLSPEDRAMTLKNDALAIQSTTAAIRGASAMGYLMMSIVGTASGGQHFGRAVEVGAASLDAAAASLVQSAGMAEARGQNDRRMQDWRWQLIQAQTELAANIKQQAAAKLGVSQARTALDQQTLQVEHHRALQAYAENKFTGRELYGWTVGQLSSIYSSAFNLALEFAHDAQQAFWFERSCEDPIIKQAKLGSLKTGLLAGQDLLLALGRLEKAYTDKEALEVEVEQTLSLRHMGTDKALGDICADWKEQKDSGIFQFTITPEFLQQDQQGKGYRRIHSIALTLPAVVGPYQNLNATLTQVHGWLPNGQTKPQTGEGQRVAISTGMNDHGVFELNFGGARFQPFEGTSAHSKWRLVIPKDASKALLDSLSDVVVKLRYKVVG